MKMFLAICYLMIFYLSNACADESLQDVFEKMERESSTFNKTVTDIEIMEYFEALLKYQPDELKRLTDQSTKERAAFLENYKNSFVGSKVKIPVLRGLSELALEQFNVIAKHQAKESIEIKSAEKRLLSFDAAEYQLMISEAKMLISKYEDYDLEEFETRVVISKDFPEKLLFMKLDTIYLLEDSCELLLHNGIGKDIGYSISRDESGDFEIRSFNHYVSWDSSKVTN